MLGLSSAILRKRPEHQMGSVSLGQKYALLREIIVLNLSQCNKGFYT